MTIGYVNAVSVGEYNRPKYNWTPVALFAAAWLITTVAVPPPETTRVFSCRFEPTTKSPFCRAAFGSNQKTAFSRDVVHLACSRLKTVGEVAMATGGAERWIWTSRPT
jgi:hypothetical protein